MSAPVTLADWLRVRPDLRRVGGEHHGACPSCGGRDRFRVLDTGAAFCRQCAPAGDADGKAIKRLQHDAGLNGAAPAIRRLPLGGADKRTEYMIRDTAGNVVAVHVRIDKLLGKDMPWFQPNGTKGLDGMKLPDLPLYGAENVPRAAQFTSLVVTEGEKCADALRAAEPTLLVLGTVTGAQSIPAPEVLQTVVDAALPIYLWPDADDEGAKHMQRIGHVLHAAGAAPLVIADAPPDTKGADAADWARLTDRPSWESLATAATPWDSTPAPATEQPKEKKKPPSGAYHAARAMEPDLSSRTMFCAGRGWYYRSSETALWQPDTRRIMLGKVQAHPEREKCQRGLRSPAIMGELEGMLDVDGATLDADKWTCGLSDGAGILDVHTGTVRPSTADDRVTKALAVAPDFTAPPVLLPWYLRELTKYCREPEKAQEFIRWYWRRALTGDCSERVMLFLFGPPRTGKSELGELMLYIAGDYGHVLPARHIVGKGIDLEHPTWLAACAGKRLIVVSDMPSTGSWQTGTVQDAVSGATMTARLIRQDGFTFKSQMHFVCTGNLPPSAPHGAGIWDRLRMVGCSNEHKDDMDTMLPARLRAEAPRILAWILGAPDKPPEVPELADMAENIRDEADPVATWIKSTWRRDANGCIPANECYGRYSDVLGKDPEVRILGEREFGKLMTVTFGEPSYGKKLGGKVVKVRRLAQL